MERTGSGEEWAGFEWDTAKAEATFRRRGLDFESAARLFDGFCLEREDMRRDYGEPRIVVTGDLNGDIVERREYLAYRETIERRDPGE
jgi:uncharacterized DUF497 family protein